MAKFRTRTISRRTVDALKVEKDTMFWDRELPGFGVRVYPSGRKIYIVQTRARGKAGLRVTIGPDGVISPEEARRRAALIIARIKAGEEPVPEPMSAKLAKGPTVETSTMGRSPVAASTASISARLASRFRRSTQRMTSTRWAFQPGSMPRPGVRPMAAASLAVATSPIRRWNKQLKNAKLS